VKTNAITIMSCTTLVKIAFLIDILSFNLGLVKNSAYTSMYKEKDRGDDKGSTAVSTILNM
jgi:hypothetical protein